VQRRFTVRAEEKGVLIVDDYGHHPVEIKATLEGARDGFEGRRVIGVFQPHRYSRVRDLFAEFCRAFNAADHVVVVPTYAAGEKPIELPDMAEGLRAHGHRSVFSAADLDSAVDHLAETVSEGDIVITLGAGNVNQVCEGLAKRLRA
jgi:UDP-N-acetylmuramate--alanine ligase